MNRPGRPRTSRPFPVHPEVAKAYSERRENPLPDHPGILKLVIEKLLERLPVKLQKQINQDLQLLATITSLEPSQISPEAQKWVITACLDSIAERPMSSQDHDPGILLIQRSIIDHYLQLHPFPSTARNCHVLREQQREWINKYAGELWVLLDASPCLCNYRRSLDGLITQERSKKPYTENQLIFDLLMEMHKGLSRSTLEKTLYMKKPGRRHPR